MAGHLPDRERCAVSDSGSTRFRAFDFALTRIDGRPLPDDELSGKPVLIVNVASRCGPTPQYEFLRAALAGDDSAA
jgi:hypothetical protein